MKKNVTTDNRNMWILLLPILVLCLGSLLYILYMRVGASDSILTTNKHHATIYRSGQVLYQLDLSTEQELTIYYPGDTCPLQDAQVSCTDADASSSFVSRTDSSSSTNSGSSSGYNVISVSGGGIAITSADCPDQICVHTGRIHNSLLPIVCLPHDLVIVVDDADVELDAITY